MSDAGVDAAVSAYLGLGSNVGDRGAHLRAAVRLLGEHGVEVDAVSSVYETDPVGEFLDQREFYNAVIRAPTTLDPIALLDLCKAVEVEQGRVFGGPRHGPRPLDVDLLMVGEIELKHERLTLPHASLRERRFVLEPLLEIESGLTLPDGAALAPILESLPPEGVERAGPLEGAGE